MPNLVDFNTVRLPRVDALGLQEPDVTANIMVAGSRAAALTAVAMGALAAGTAIEQGLHSSAPFVAHAPREAPVVPEAPVAAEVTSIVNSSSVPKVSVVSRLASRAGVAVTGPVEEGAPSEAAPVSVADAPLITVAPNQMGVGEVSGPTVYRPTFSWARLSWAAVGASAVVPASRAWSNSSQNSASGALQSMAEGVVSERVSSTTGEQEVSLFVASDDKALNWTMNKASPDYREVTYEEDRVEMGNLAAGVALSVNNLRLAAAYVERDAPTRFGDRDEKYAGVILTYRH